MPSPFFSNQVSNELLTRANLLSELRLYVSEDCIQIIKSNKLVDNDVLGETVKRAKELNDQVVESIEKEFNLENNVKRQLSLRSRKE